MKHISHRNNTLKNRNCQNRTIVSENKIEGWLFYECNNDMKHRWFTYSNESNQLEYFLNPKSLNRIGAISIESAAFNIHATKDSNKLHILEIFSENTTHKLLHEDEEELILWKTFLQDRRHIQHMTRIEKGVHLVESIPQDSTFTYQSRFGTSVSPLHRDLEPVDSRRIQSSSAMDSHHNLCKGSCEFQEKYFNLMERYETLLDLFDVYKKCLYEINEPETQKRLDNILRSIDRMKTKSIKEPFCNEAPQDSWIKKYHVAIRERNLFKRQNSILQTELVNIRRYWTHSVQNEHFLIVGYEKLGPVYRQQREMIHIATKAFGIDLEKMEIDSAKSEEAHQYFEDVYKTVIQQTDEYGFFQNYDIAEKLNCLQELENVSNGFQYIREADTTAFDRLQLDRWNHFIEEWDEEEPLNKNPQLKTLLRNGIPSCHRGRVWQKLTQLYIRKIHDGVDFKAYYFSILENVSDKNPFSRQIDLDIQRTLTENIFFDVPEASDSTDCIKGSKLPQLRNILLAFSHEHKDTVGYCQGLDRLGAILLLNMPEEMAFWTMIMIVNRLRPPHYYTASLLDAQADQKVFKTLLQDQIPILYKKLEDFDVDVSLFSFKWFLTMFVDGFSWKIYMKIWDAFLYEGDKIIFRYAMAILIYLEPLLIYQDNLSGLMKILRSAGQLVKDHCRLTHIAFQDLRAFPKRRISEKRLAARTKIEEEQTNLNIQRGNRKDL